MDIFAAPLLIPWLWEKEMQKLEAQERTRRPSLQLEY
jgi:hypothetical protein